MAPPDMVKRVGIGSRMRMVFSDVAPGLSLPQWTMDEGAPQPAKPWRYPQRIVLRTIGRSGYYMNRQRYLGYAGCLRSYK